MGANPPDQQRRPLRREERRLRLLLLRRDLRAALRLELAISIYYIEMKRTRLLAILLAVAAVFLTGLGGAMDFSKAGLTKTHAWNDGHFLMLFAIFMLLL